jgi:uncharacterized PurR-regulated membrane protein YhhQ (DUF165 family)
MNALDTFLGFLFAFIVKDFYDIFIQNHIIKLLHKSKWFMRFTGETVVKTMEK